MVGSSKPSLIPLVILLTLFIGALLAIHQSVNSLFGREISDFAVLIAFFSLIVLLVRR